IVLVFHLVVAEREADSAAVLPRPRLLVFPPSLIFTGSKVPMGSTPAVVDHPIGNRGVVALEQSMKRETATALTCLRPVDVVPQHVRCVPCYEILHMEVCIGVVGGIHRSQAPEICCRGDRRQVCDRPVQPS